MRKNFRMYLTLALVMLGVMSVNAQELVSLQDVPFTTWVGGNDGYGKDATAGEEAGCAWVLDEPTGQPYGDGSVINGADLSLYSKLIITYTAGTPRVMLNRDVNEGQWNGDESASKLIEYPKDGGWSQKYFNDNGSTLIVDLKQIMKDKGYVRLHAIKGANWNDVTVTSMMLERQGKAQQVGWTNLINNSDMEGDDVSSFFSKVNAGPAEPSVITDGIGKDGSRGIMVATTALPEGGNDYDNQFWFRFNEPLPAGTKYKVSFDYRADQPAAVGTQAHAEPSDYIHWQLWDDINFDSQWQTFTREGEVTAEQSTDSKQFLSAAFNLSKLADANNYYFDNIKFEVYKYGTVVEYDMDVIQIDFGFDTNIPELVNAGGKPRLMFPEGTATVKVNGEDLEITSVEGFADGRFYIFHEESLSDGDEVEVTFTNPTDPAYHIIYTSGPGGDASNFTMLATNNPAVAADDTYSYLYVTPVVLKMDPEDGSFNLPNNIAEFKITFDKNVDCAALVATLGSEKLTVTPAEGFAEEVILTRAGGDLATGEYILTLDKVYPDERISDEIFETYTFTLNIGKVDADPNDVPKEMLADTFNECVAGNIPEGYFVKMGDEERPGGSTQGSGSRMFDFGGGDFTKGLYFREGYVEYGSTEGYALTLQAGKKYQIHFNSAMWKDNGGSMRFEVFNEAQEQVLVEMITNTPNLNGGQGVVSGSTSTTINFVPETTGNYVVRWTSAGSVDGNPAYMEVVLANPSVKYIPNAPGVEEVNALNTALADAKTTHEACSDERYAGEAFNALDAAIKKYEAEKDGYTAPSKYWNAVEDLTNLSNAMNTHRTNCDDYDQNLAKAIDLVAQYGETKFKNAPQYAQLATIAAKYEGKVLTNDAELSVAVTELKQIVDLTSVIFTEGESKTGDGGIHVLVERIRLGVEALKSLGVPEDDEIIVAANNAMTDDDALAEAVKMYLTKVLYGQLKDPNNELFKTIVDDESLEETTPMYDMTVFVKNPNIYALQPGKPWSEENVPGWVVPTGNGEFNNMWDSRGIGRVEGVAEDVAFTKWHSNARMEQTIGDLPAGVYTVVVDAVNWDNEDGTDGYAFVKTSDTPATEEGAEEQFAASVPLEHWGQYQGHHDNLLENVVVTDGILTIGVNFGAGAQYEFDKVKVYLSAPATGFDYASAYEEVVNGVEDAKAETVRAIQLYDLNGNRITTARKGIVIVKKIMSDGSVRTEKVIKK